MNTCEKPAGRGYFVKALQRENPFTHRLLDVTATPESYPFHLCRLRISSEENQQRRKSAGG